MTYWTRRKFIKTTGAGVALSVAPAVVTRAFGRAAPSERVRHAVVGTGGRGRRLSGDFAKMDDCDVVAVCDVDPKRRSGTVRELGASSKVAQHADYRRIIGDKSIDSVVIATADHWHTPIALAAILSGGMQ